MSENEEGEFKKRLKYEESGEWEKFVADLMVEYGPDRHSDGSDVIAQKILEKFQQMVEVAKTEFEACESVSDFYICRKKWFGE